jgi:hypothetical protein
MAGKTLPGIGEDESGEHDFAGASDSGVRAESGLADGNTGPRSTDRMPATMPVASGFSGPTIVDDDKVAEGLKKLRSLDEPLGPMPTAPMTTGTIQPGSMAPTVTPVSSMPTLKEGMPVVGGPTPVVTPAVAAAELLRSRGTAHGHALSGNSVNPALLPVSVDDRMKGTLLGHSLHLPDLPLPGEAEAEKAPRAAEVRSIAAVQQVPPAGALRPSELVADFSNGDSRFFETEAIGNDLDLERPRPNKMFRAVVFFAVVSVFGVAAFAWVNARKSSDAEAQATSPAPAPEPTAAAPAPTPEPAAAPAAAAPPPAAAPAAAAAAPAEVVAAPAAAEPPPAPAPRAESPTTKVRRELPAVEETKLARPSSHASSSSTRTARHSDSTRDAPTAAAKPTPTPTPTKHGKAVEDPDGTLPLSD